MHQFKIECNQYNPDGTLMPGIAVTKYADNWEQARLMCQELRAARFTDEDGNPTTQKVYNVMLYTLAYKIIANQTDFFAQFQA